MTTAREQIIDQICAFVDSAYVAQAGLAEFIDETIAAHDADLREEIERLTERRDYWQEAYHTIYGDSVKQNEEIDRLRQRCERMEKLIYDLDMALTDSDADGDKVMIGIELIDAYRIDTNPEARNE